MIFLHKAAARSRTGNLLLTRQLLFQLSYDGLAARLLPDTSLCYGSRWTDMQGTPQLKPCKWSGETRTHNVTLLAALPLELHSIPFCGTDTSYSKTIVTLEARSHFTFCDRNSLIKPPVRFMTRLVRTSYNTSRNLPELTAYYSLSPVALISGKVFYRTLLVDRISCSVEKAE